MAAVAVSELPEFVEVEPNDALEASTPVTIPCAVSGLLQCENDHDFYEFAAAQGQRISLSAHGRRYGSPAYVFMTLYDSAGQVVAKTQVADSEEWTLSYSIASDGIYRLAARDLLHRGGASFAYRLQLQSGPDFSLVLKNDKNADVKLRLPRADGARGLTVEATRHDYDGPIRLALDPADTGLRVYNNLIPARANEVRMYVAAPPECGEAELRMIRIVGTADINGRAVRRALRTEPTLRAKLPQVLYPPAWYDGLILSAVIAPARPLFDIQADQESIAWEDGRGEYVFCLERKDNEFKAEVNVFVEGLTPGFEASVKADNDKYTVAITGDGRKPPDQLKFRLVCIGEHQGRGQAVTSEIAVAVNE
jgi:hypothetical protein